MIKKHLKSRFQTLLCKLILTQSSSKRQFITVRVSGLRLHSSMFYTTSKMSDMEVYHIFCISFLYRDSKWIERVKSECHQPLSCWWNWATQETSMDLKFQKPWIPRIKPAKERNISNTNFARFKFTINRKKVLNCNFFTKLCTLKFNEDIVSPLHPKITLHILHLFLNRFLVVLTWKICSTIESFSWP